MGPEIPDRHATPDPDRWTKAVDASGLSRVQQQELLETLQRYEEVFSDLPGDAKIPAFRVETGQASPVSAKPYTVPLPYLEEARAELKNMEELGIIEDSVSPWSCPVICVPKRGGGIRLPEVELCDRS